MLCTSTALTRGALRPGHSPGRQHGNTLRRYLTIGITIFFTNNDPKLRLFLTRLNYYQLGRQVGEYWLIPVSSWDLFGRIKTQTYVLLQLPAEIKSVHAKRILGQLCPVQLAAEAMAAAGNGVQER